MNIALEKVTAFYDFINEREGIRLLKESGAPRPWTDDPILQEYKFTNVRRHHDWTSNQLRVNFYDEHFNDPKEDILMNCALARYFGTFEFMRAVGWQTYADFDFEEIKHVASNRLNRGKRVFTGAYVITNQGMSIPKQEAVVDYFLKDLHACMNGILDVVQMTRSWERTANYMKAIKGFGGTGFMTKEILLDTTYTGFWLSDAGGTVKTGPDGRFSLPDDWWTWTPVGPGARRGIKRLLGFDDPKNDGGSIKDDALLYHINYVKDFQHDFWKHRGILSPTDIQFQLCEFDKYERVRLGQGRPRSKYSPR